MEWECVYRCLECRASSSEYQRVGCKRVVASFKDASLWISILNYSLSTFGFLVYSRKIYLIRSSVNCSAIEARPVLLLKALEMDITILLNISDVDLKLVEPRSARAQNFSGVSRA